MPKFCYHGSVEADDKSEKHMQKAGVSECLLRYMATHKSTSEYVWVYVSDVDWDG